MRAQTNLYSYRSRIVRVKNRVSMENTNTIYNKMSEAKETHRKYEQQPPQF
jgi:hypothetical protein